MNAADSGAGSLRQAILGANAAAGPDTIAFASGLSGTVTLTSGQLDITDDLTITGPGAGQLAISGNNASRVFAIAGRAVSLSGLATTGGVADWGAGIYAESSSLAVSHCTFAGNTGGSIYNTGTLTVGGSTFAGNTGTIFGVRDVLTGLIQAAPVGSGVYNVNGGVANVGTSAFTDNTGSAIFNDYYNPALPGSAVPTVLVSGSTFSGNEALNGGGLTNWGGVARVNSCTFTHNAALSSGGGINSFNSTGTLVVSNSTFADNLAGYTKNGQLSGQGVGFGGGITSGGGSAATVTNCTFSGNRAFTLGSGIFSFQGAMTVRNTIVFGGTAPRGPDLFGLTSEAFNLIGVNPLLAPLGNYGGPTQTMPPCPGARPWVPAASPWPWTRPATR
jgi:hypothetical protein